MLRITTKKQRSFVKNRRFRSFFVVFFVFVRFHCFRRLLLVWNDFFRRFFTSFFIALLNAQTALSWRTTLNFNFLYCNRLLDVSLN